MNYLCITVRWLDDRYHGKDANGEPEWPPSPLRLFQAMVAGAYRRYGETDSFHPSFRWLQSELEAPLIVAPRTQQGQPFTRFVPNNDSDKDFERQDRLTAKTVRPTLLLEPFPIHYVWPLPEPLTDDARRFADELREIATSVVSFGWGVDMTVAGGLIVSDEHVNSLSGGAPGTGRRVPGPDTLDALIDRYKLFVNRLQIDQYTQHVDGLRNGCLTDLPPLDRVAFRTVCYRRATDPAQRPFAAFSILKPHPSGMRSFDTTRRARDVAGMLRHAVADAASQHGWPDEQINVFVHGKTPDGTHPANGERSPDRFMYLPLPTINQKLGRVESIRRVLIAAPAHCGEQIAWVRRALSGRELKDTHGEATSLLTILAGSDWVLQQYIREARTWSTVTPVILPGHDDNNADKAAKLLRKAFAQAGYARELVEQTAMEWRRVGFRAGVDLALRYLPPENLDDPPRYHVRVRFPHAIRGPLAIGGGRFRGFGLFAAMDDR